MSECWLRPNRRALSLGLLLPLVFVLSGVGLLLGFAGSDWNWWLRGIGWTLILIGSTFTILLSYFLFLPRLAYQNGKLLAYLDSSQPIQIPAEVVECFFLGQAPVRSRSHEESDSEQSTIVVRLAEAAKDWHHRDIKPALGHWCDGYITINGAWCEPIDGKLLEKMNRRLNEVHKELRASRGSEG